MLFNQYLLSVFNDSEESEDDDDGEEIAPNLEQDWLVVWC